MARSTTAGCDAPISNSMRSRTSSHCSNMKANMAKYGITAGFHIALDDMPPPPFVMSVARMMQEILSGNKDLDKLLRMLDEDWDSARK